jgi:hypothetical protein
LLGARTTVLLDMGPHCLFGVASGIDEVPGRDMSMVRRCFVASSLVMLGGFLVVTRCIREML